MTIYDNGKEVASIESWRIGDQVFQQFHATREYWNMLKRKEVESFGEVDWSKWE